VGVLVASRQVGAIVTPGTKRAYQATNGHDAKGGAMPQAQKLTTYGLTGERGLLAAVILQALKDFTEGGPELRRDAAAYFASDTYRHHMQSLGLPDHWQPQALRQS